MADSELRYSVRQGGFIDKWLISEVIATPVSMTPVPDIFPNYCPGASVKDSGGKERKSPAKQEYLRIGDFRKQGYPDSIAIDKLYYPADTSRVDCSRVFKFPTDARFYAKAYARCDKETKIEAALFCCGGIKLWINGCQVAQYYPYESNIECRKDVELVFKEGVNEILVGVNDYGERNIVFKFGFKITDGELDISLPIDADVEKIAAMRRNLSSMYLDRLNYREGSAYLCTEEGFADDFEFSVCAEDIPEFICRAHKGEKRALLFDVDNVVSGYHELSLSTVVEGVELKTALCAQVCPKRRERESMNLIDFNERRKFCIEYAAECGDNLDNYIASLECGRDEYNRCEAEISHDLDFAERRGDCADFRVQRFIWLMYRFENRIPKNLRDRIERLILEFRYWFDEPGNDAMWFFSENHALAFHSDEYLAGQLYPDEVFPNSGLTGREHMAKARLRIVEWFEKLLRSGYNEWNSATYVNVDVFTYITLYSLCEDSEIKELARKALNCTFEMYAYNSFKGVMGTSNGRTYNKDILGNECMAGNSQMWLAWGVGCLNRRISPAMYIAMSDYVPSGEFSDVASGNFSGRLIREKTEGTLEVPTYLCKTSRYILGTCVSPRTGGPGSQELLLSIFLSDAATRIWMNMPGESNLFGIRRPGYFSGNALTPLVTQKENVAVVSYNFPKVFLRRCEVGYIHIMCDEQECDEVILRENALFVRRGEAFAAIICHDGRIVRTDRTALMGKEFVFDGVNSNWLIKVSDTTEFGSFEKFVEYHVAHMPKVRGSKLIFEDAQLGTLKFELLTKDYLIRKVGIKRLVRLGVSKDMIKQFFNELLKCHTK